MALYQVDTHWSDISLILPSLRTLPSGGSSGTLLNLSNPIILTSTSLDRLSFTNLVPSFPPGHQPPLFTLIDLQEENPSIEDMSRIATLRYEERVTVSAPTIPRMKALLEEKIVVDKWTVRPQTPPGHVPWGNIGLTKICSGRNPNPMPRGPTEILNVGRDLAQSPDLRTSRRNALALDGSITYVSKETANAQDENLIQKCLSEKVHGKQFSGQVEVQAPTLQENQGYSHASFYPIVPRRHPNLAIRRGHKAFPSLKLNQVANKRKKRDPASSDSIPTAFRGSPTVYCSPIWPHAQRPGSQNLTLVEMLENLREKCASFSSRVSLPPDWFYRPRSQAKDLTKLSDTEPQSDEDEWAFAEPLMDMINSFSTQADNSGTHFIVLKDDDDDDILELPIVSRALSDTTGAQAESSPVEHDLAEKLSGVSGPPTRYLPVRPSLISPTSLRTASRGIRKTVRFADGPTLFAAKDRPVVFPNKCTTTRRESVVLSAWISPTPQLSVVRTLQSAKPSRNSWTNRLRSDIALKLPPPPPPPSSRRPLSHRYPTTPKLPLFMDGGTGARMLSGSPYVSPRDIVGKSPSVHSPLRKGTFLRKGKGIKENLKISHPIPITSIPRPKQRARDECGTTSRGSKNQVNSPLRSIFMKLK